MQALINQIFVTYNPGVTSDQNFFVHSNNINNEEYNFF